ncbi:TPA: hypothetical protein ENS27_11745 [bacterium]|nr:hypothetical protein [bacterium]
MDGTKSCRLLGRLGFFNASDLIKHRLSNHLIKIQSPESQNEMEGMAKIDTTKINIYIVSSIAGGTGGGMFLDMAFFTKSIIQNANIYGFLVLPSFFSDDYNKKMYANGYSALKELDFYSSRKDIAHNPSENIFNEFSAEWKIDDKKLISGPPFNTCYLIDNCNFNYNLSISEQQSEVFDMIAESIFVDFLPDKDLFALRKRSIRESLTSAILNDMKYEYLDSKGNTTHSEIRTCRYSTFGYSKIYMPIKRIENICSYKLSEDLVEFWLRKNPVTDKLKDEIKDDLLPKLGMRMNDVSSSDIFITLSKIGDDNISKIIGQWASQQEKACADKINSKSRDINGFISKIFDEYVNLNYRDSEGQFLKSINIQNKSDLIKEIQSKITNETAKMLDEREKGIYFTIKNLDLISEFLNEWIKSYEEDHNISEIKANDIHKDIDKTLQLIKESEKSWLYRKSVLVTHSKTIFDIIKSYLNMRARMMIDKTASEICRELKPKIDDIINEISYLIKSLNILKNILHEKYESYDKSGTGIINHDVYKKGDFMDLYYINDKPITETTLESLSSDFFLSTKIDGLLELKDILNDKGTQYIESQILDFCKLKFADIKSQEKADVIKKLSKQYPNEKYKQLVDGLHKMGSGWLKQGSHFIGDVEAMSNIKSMAYLGIASKQDDEYGEFIRLFKSINNEIDRINVDSNNICYYSECAGIPLVYIANLDKYKQCYMEIANQDLSAFHIDDTKYPDIMLNTEEEIAVLKEASRIFLTSTILGILNVSFNSDGKLIYNYTCLNGKTLNLGIENSAIEKIKTDFDLRLELDHRVTDITNNFDNIKLIQYYVILGYWIEKLFSPRLYKIGNEITEILTFENRILTTIQDEIKQKLLNATSEEKLNKQLSLMQKKINDFSFMIDNRRIIKIQN